MTSFSAGVTTGDPAVNSLKMDLAGRPGGQTDNYIVYGLSLHIYGTYRWSSLSSSLACPVSHLSAVLADPDDFLMPATFDQRNYYFYLADFLVYMEFYSDCLHLPAH